MHDGGGCHALHGKPILLFALLLLHRLRQREGAGLATAADDTTAEEECA